MIYSIVIPTGPSPAGGLAPSERPWPRRVMPLIEVSPRGFGVGPGEREESRGYDRQGRLEARRDKGLFIDEVP